MNVRISENESDIFPPCGVHTRVEVVREGGADRDVRTGVEGGEGVDGWDEEFERVRAGTPSSLNGV